MGSWASPWPRAPPGEASSLPSRQEAPVAPLTSSQRGPRRQAGPCTSPEGLSGGPSRALSSAGQEPVQEPRRPLGGPLCVWLFQEPGVKQVMAVLLCSWARTASGAGPACDQEAGLPWTAGHAPEPGVFPESSPNSGAGGTLPSPSSYQ